jgi:putative ABC transport system substrate-binding protein
MPLIGYLNSESRETYREFFSAFHRGLNETGFIEDRNVIIEYRWAEGHNDRLPAMAADLTRRRVAVIATNNTPSALAAKAATQTIPTVFLTGSDPVLIGLVASLNRPTGTLTGVAVLNTGMVAKRLQLLHEFVPTSTSIGVLVNSTNHPPDKKERFDQHGQVGELLDKLLDARLEPHLSDYSDLEAEVA